MGWAPRQVAAFVATCLFVSVMPTMAGASVAVKQPAKPKPPKEWDERVQPFVDFVEDERGLEFKHPAKVEFLSDQAFRKRVRVKEKDLTKKDRERADQSAGQLRALGLIEGDVDLLEASSDLGEAGIVGYYDSEKKVLVIRGEEIADASARVTVVHELTHALQDQHFNLFKLRFEAKGSDAASALQALIEGDAVAVHSSYLETLPQAERDQYLGTDGTPTLADELLPEGVPPVLEAFLLAPYALGAPFIAGLDADDDPKARDRAFRNPPQSEEQLIDPVAWQERDRPAKVAAPELQNGEKGHGKPDDFGVFTLYLILGSRLELGTALSAVTGWEGDSYRAYRSDGRECLRAVFAMDTSADRDELEAALQSWATSSSGGATVRRRGDEVELTACEAEGVAAPTQAVIDRATSVLASRVYVALGLAGEGIGLEPAVCLADQLIVDEVVFDILTRLSTEGITPSVLPRREQAQLTQATQDAARTCDVPLPRR